MQLSDAPKKISIAFSRDGDKRSIPNTSQIGVINGAASYPTGFPPLTFIAKENGGIPPDGEDFNGVFYEITNVERFLVSGGIFKYDSAHSLLIGGYPLGAVLLNDAGTGMWRSTVDNNTSNPNAGGAGWTAGFIQAGTGAVDIDPQIKMRQVVSVLDFGAKADGVTDDRQAIQRAIDAVALAGGGTVELMTGTHMLSVVNYVTDGGAVEGVTSIKLKSNVSIRGKGSASILKVMNTQYGSGALYRMISSGDNAGRVSNCVLQDFDTDGNKANQVASIQASNILLDVKANVKVLNVGSTNANGNAIMLRGTLTDPAINLEVAGCKINGSTAIGIQCSQFDGLSIHDNYVGGSVDNAVDVYGENGTTTCNGVNFSIYSNHIKGTQSVGIFLETVSDGVCYGNTIRSSNIAITVNRINGEPRNIRVFGNNSYSSFIGFRGTGDTKGVDVHNNTFSYFAQAGVSLGANGSSVGNQSYFDISSNTFVPQVGNIPIILLAGDVNSYNTGRDNKVIFEGITEGYLFVDLSATSVANDIKGFRVLPFQVGPDLAANYAQIKRIQLLDGLSSDNATGPVVINLPDNSAGRITITNSRGGLGYSAWEQPYIKRAGTLVLGVATKTFISAECIAAVSVVSGNASVTFVNATNNFMRWGLVFTPVQ